MHSRVHLDRTNNVVACVYDAMYTQAYLEICLRPHEMQNHICKSMCMQQYHCVKAPHLAILDSFAATPTSALNMNSVSHFSQGLFAFTLQLLQSHMPWCVYNMVL